MVNLRTRSALASAVLPVNNVKSITQSFIGDKATSNRKRVKAAHTADAVSSGSSIVEEGIPLKKARKVALISNKVAVTEEKLPFLSRQEVLKCTTIDYPSLPFHLPDAVQHLRNADIRFYNLLDTMELTPYKELEDGRVKELDLFKTLTSSVLGQQISWLAARAILYKFVRLFFPSLPEKPDFNLTPRENLPFPHPIDVASDDCTEEKLRSAGLSGAKVKYVKDIATRFADGRLDVRKIILMEEEECITELVKIRGIGVWSAHMTIIFALRRRNVLPVGDLGVQKGMVLFYLSGREGPSTSKRKKVKAEIKSEADVIHTDNEPVGVIETHLKEARTEVESTIGTATGPEVKVEEEDVVLATMQPLPEGITSSLLKSRADGKKAKGNVYLTPSEMEALAASWAPYRSVASFLMWTIESK